MKPTVDIVIPVYNEETILSRNINILNEYLEKYCEYPWRIIIANNGSTDETENIGNLLANKYKSILLLSIPEKGRGKALNVAWSQSEADIVAYLDIDLSTRLKHLNQLIQAIEEGSEIAIGSRLLKKSRVRRSFLRTTLSKIYNFLIKILFLSKFSDAQCGFKAFKQSSITKILPLVKNKNWFFDTEILLIYEKNKIQISEIPVEWEEDSNSKVKIIKTIIEDIKGLLRLRFKGIPTIKDS